MLVLLCIFRLLLEKFGMGLAVCQIALTVKNVQIINTTHAFVPNLWAHEKMCGNRLIIKIINSNNNIVFMIN